MLTCQPIRLHRTRGKGNFTPLGAIYVGRGTLWANPFSRRYSIGHARSVILYGHWLAGDLSPRILRLGRFTESEIEALARWRLRLIRALPYLQGRNLQCWCPLTSAWCHADTLIRVANGAQLPRLAA